MTEPYFKNVLLLSNANKFEKLLSECLVHKYKVNVKTNLHNMDKLHNVDVVIINMLEKRKEIKAEIQKIKEIETVKKIILLEDGNEIYSNSKVIPPYSVYKKLVPKNKKCLRLQQIEKMLFPDLKIEVVIFRISKIPSDFVSKATSIACITSPSYTKSLSPLVSVSFLL